MEDAVKNGKALSKLLAKVSKRLDAAKMSRAQIKKLSKDFGEIASDFVGSPHLGSLTQNVKKLVTMMPKLGKLADKIEDVLIKIEQEI